jgi:OHCU decarboxylase
MRSDPREFDLISPANLNEAVQLLASEPGAWTPIAGGTDLMVQFAAGTLRARKLLSLWNLPELRRIEATPEEVRIGAASTYTDLLRNQLVTAEFPLLVRAASWTGGIANQSRGTLGGNIANASPAADSLPPLLAYEAELVLTSARGERRVPYRGFHSAYKKMGLASGELIKAICMPRRYSEYVHYSRKVGARNAQAISKVCIAALASMEGDTIGDIRIALGSVAPIPLRLFETESLLNGKPLDESAIATARKSVQREIAPIDDIRSSAQYRAAVTANLLEEFLRTLLAKKENLALARWNRFSAAEAEGEILACCGSRSWADAMTARRPFASLAELISAANEVWRGLGESDWLEAFRSHPQIGELHAEQKQSARSAQWSAGEQGGTASAEETVKLALAEGNREYERRFGHIFIVCASGKSAAEMLDILRRRLHNDAQGELREAAEQQRQITELRLRKWLAEKA